MYPQRTTRRELDSVIAVINGHLERNGSRARIMAQWAYGRPRVHIAGDGENFGSNLSPRLPMGELYRWLWAFEKGLAMGIDLGTPQAPPIGPDGEEIEGEAFTTDFEECPLCKRDMTALADEAMRWGKPATGTCKGCGATVTASFTEEIAWSFTATLAE